jgi:PAS domain S-box-containing protein
VLLLGPNDVPRRALSINAWPIRDEEGEIWGALAQFQDATLERKREQALRESIKRFRLFRRLDRAILEAYSEEPIAEAGLKCVRTLLDCPWCGVTLFDPETRGLSFTSLDAKGLTPLHHRDPLHRIWLMEHLEDGKMAFIRDLSSSSIPPSSRIELETVGVQSLVLLPLMSDEGLDGALNLGMRSGLALSSEELELAREIARQLTFGFQQVRLRRTVQRRTLKLEQSVARRTASLQASEARFRTIFEDAVIGIALIDHQGRILAGNPALQRMVGHTEQELRQTLLENLLRPTDAEYVTTSNDLFRNLVLGDLDFYQTEQQYVTDKGETRWAQLTVSGVDRAEERVPQLFVAMFEDVTEEKRAQSALIQTEKLALAGRLGASLAHEINNPLQAVLGCLGLAREQVDQVGEVYEYLQIAIEELERASDIVTQLRDLNRPSEHLGERQRTDLNVVIESVLVLSRKQCRDHGIEVLWSPETDLPRPRISGDHLRQVFLNIVLNAIKAMPGGGQLRVGAEHTMSPEGVRVRFSDTGTGIEPSELEHIFEPFQSTREDGMGLGLYISRHIVKAHSGRIDVTSQVGQGADVEVWLPL